MSENFAASVRARLANLARERKEDIGLMFTHYGLEWVLYRLSQSAYADRFLLKEPCFSTCCTMYRIVQHVMLICWVLGQMTFSDWNKCFVTLLRLLLKMV